jgi:hypothetical protein
MIVQSAQPLPLLAENARFVKGCIEKLADLLESPPEPSARLTQAFRRKR